MIWRSEGIYTQAKAIKIGERLHSDHARIVLQWECASGYSRQFSWVLNNWLLEAKGLKENVAAKMTSFLEINLGSQDMINIRVFYLSHW